MANLVETVADQGDFRTLLTAVNASGLSDVLSGEGPYTVLAPTDAAFAKLPSETIDALLQDKTRLKRVVAYHVLFGDVRSDDLTQIDEAPTVEGSVVAIEHQNGDIRVNQAKVLSLDILTENGVIHAIDTVLMPGLLAENA